MKKFILPFISFFIASGLLHSQTDTESYLGKENQNLSGQLIGSKKIRFVDYPDNGSYKHSTYGDNRQVSSSEDASIISVTHGAYPYDTHILQYNTETNDWDFIGTIPVRRTFDSKLSADGSKILISSHPSSVTMGPQDISVYQRDGTTSNWNLVATVDPSITPYAISFSDDGSTIAIGDFSSGSSKGKVQIYSVDYLSNPKTLNLLTEFNGEESNDAFGKSLDLNNDGSILAIGAPEAPFSSTAYGKGYVKIYKQGINNSWSQLGQKLDGESSGDRFGQAVDLSFDGLILAIGSPTNDPSSNNNDDGQVEVYSFDDSNNNWVQLGQDLEHQGDYDNPPYDQYTYTQVGNQFGTSVALSGDGTILAVSAPRNSTTTNKEGYVETFQLVTNTWVSVQITRPWDLFNRNTSDYDNGFSDLAGQNFGYTIAISKNGEKFIGSTNTGSQAGYVAAVRTGYISAPTISISASETTSGSTTNDSYLSLTFTTSAETTSFSVDDVSVSGGYLDEFSETDSTTYSAKLYATSDGQVSVVVNEAQFTDSANAPNTQSNTFIWNYDGTIPTVTITSSDVDNGDTSNDSSISLTFTTSEATSDFAASDITVSAGTLSSFTATSTTVYTAILTPSGDATYTIDVNAGVFTDSASNGNTATTQFSWTYDSTAPALSAVSIASDNSDTSLAKVGDEITLSITASETIQTPTVTIYGNNATVSGSGASWSATYTLQTGDTEGAIGFTVDFDDAVGNTGTQVTATTDSSSVTFDETLPALSAVSIASDNSDTSLAKVGDEITLSITASETIQTPTVTIYGNNATVSGSGASWSATYTLQTGDTEGAIGFTVDFDDAVGNTGTQVTATTDSSSVTFDETLPALSAVSIASDNSDTSLAKVGDEITLSITASETIQTPTVTIYGNNATVSGSGASWSATYTLQTGDTEGAIGFTVDFDDAVGNTGTQVTATTDSSSVTFDETLPTVTITSSDVDNGDTSNNPSISLTFTTSEATSDFAASDITVSAGTLSSFIATSTTVYTAILTPSGDATYTIDVNAGVFTDSASNGNTATTQFSWTFVANTSPTGTPLSRSFTQDDADIEIDLTEGVTDPDGDELSVSDFVIEYLLGDSEGDNYAAVTDPVILAGFEKIVKTASLTGNKLQLNLSLSNFLTGLETGKIRLSYNITDGTISIPVSTEIPITGKNDPPAAQDEVETQTVVLEEDGTVKQDADGNDVLQTIEEGVKVIAAVEGSDPDRGDTIAYELAPDTSVSEGTLTFNADGSYSFEPEEHFYGEVTFDYYVEDSFGAKQGPYKVTIVIAESPDDDGIPTTLETLGKSTDIDGDGIPDRKQNNISHFPMSSYAEFAAAKAWANGEGGTQPAQSKYGAILVGSISDKNGQFSNENYKSDPNAKLKDLGIVAIPENIQESFEFKADLYQFSIIPEPGKELTDLDENPNNGLQTRIVLDLPEGIEATTYIKKDSEGNFFSFKDDQDLSTFDDGATLIDTNGDGLIDRIVVTLTDNAKGDNDPRAGYFTDPGGLGQALPEIDDHTTSPLDEGQAVDTFIYDVNEKSTGTDFDLEGDELTYTIASSNAETIRSALKIDSSTGILSVKESEFFDFESFVDNQGVANMEVLVQVNDPFGNEDLATITIPLTNVDEYPRIITSTAVEFLEQQPTDIVVVDVETLPDYQDITTYTILNGKDGAAFNLDSTTGELKFNFSPVYFEKQQYVLDIQASDILGKTDSAEFTITILPLNSEDDDNDGTLDTDDAFPLDPTEDTDTDGDGTGNNADTDDDNDGTLDTDDAFPLDPTEDTDTDGDGTGNNADTDDDNDGTLDTDDAFPLDPTEDTDTDGDGTGNNADTDDDNDGTLDTDDAFPLDPTEDTDTDGDGTGNNADTDDDNDGTLDTDDAFPLDPTEDTDTDGDGTGNNADTDDDNDGTLDTDDAFPLDSTEDTDTDGDGTGNNADTDDDNDGTLDTDDAFPLDPTEDTDTDGDGTGNNADTDDDNDGTLDTDDAFPLDPTEDTDTDGDGTGNNADTDDDNDGTLDTDDAFPLDPTEDTDTDGDGTGNNADTDDDNDGTLDTDDAFPLDPTEDTDTDGDGTGNNADTDDDNDGTLDTDDAFPLDPTEDTDTDGDGTGNNADTDDDNDGTLDTDDAFPLDPTEDTDTDGDGTGNNADTDDDNDGTLDTDDAFPLDPTEDTDTDGDGTGNNADTDDDNDGTLDTDDAFPLDSTEDTDTDGDGTGNNADTDDDNDGVLDGTEKTDGTDGLDSCDFVLASQTVTPSTAWNAADCDSDGVSNADELTDGTDPLNPDSDGDGVLDGTEKTDGTDGLDSCDFVLASQTVTPSTAWNAADCDSDGVSNADELTDGTDLLNPDSDGDGVLDGAEKTDGTDGLDFCSSIPSNITLSVSQGYLAADCDGDGLSNGDEIGLDASNPIDSDNDGVFDYLEFNKYEALIEDDLEVFNLLTPNNDGENDVFVIRNISLYPENRLEIYNRWGVKVYDVTGYGQRGRYFVGESSGRATIQGSSLLPTGTYFYILKYKSTDGVWKDRRGYLYLTR